MKKIALLLVILLSIISYSQNNPQWIIYNTSNSNLPSNSIDEIVIDNQNRKWVSIWGYGLVEIDGNNWMIIDTTNSGIPSNMLKTINVDYVGNFWAGGWLDYFNYRLTKFDGINWTIWDSSNSPIPESYVMSVVFDNMNDLWLLCMDPSYVYDDNYIVELTQDSSWILHSSFLDDIGSRQMLFDNNVLWIAGSHGLHKFEGDSLIYFPGYGGQYPTDIKKDLTGNIWTATGQAGWGQLNKFDGSTFTSYLNVNAISIEVDSFNNIWAGTQNLGLGYSELIKFDGINWTYFNPLNSELPQTYSISDLTFDKFGNLWIATQSAGLVVFNENGIVPVELTSFTSSINENDVTLNWQTATETNNQGFQIERRKTQDERSGEWINIGFVNGSGTTTEPQSYSFVDENLSAGKYQYRLKQFDFDGTFEYSNTIEVEINSPTKFSLEQNYPNPFNPSTSIQYAISSRQFVTLKVYDVLGKEVITLANEEKPAGMYNVEFRMQNLDLSSGIYFYQLKAGDYIETKKMILMK